MFLAIFAPTLSGVNIPLYVAVCGARSAAAQEEKANEAHSNSEKLEGRTGMPDGM